MIPNASITVYNMYADPTSRSKKYIRNVVNKVVWESQRAVNGLRSGALASNTTTILIPMIMGKDYLDPIEWINLSTENKASKWTLKDGDVIVRGVASEELSDSYTVTNLKEDYQEVVVITSVDPMDQGSSAVRHWQVGAK